MKPAAGTRKPYIGSTRSLVLALDVGTTFSGVSYGILEPGEIPKIHGVTRFPGQEHVAGNSKIPSIMYYDANSEMKAAGAEAENATLVAEAEDENWTKVELFKLRLRPKSMKLKMNGMRLAPLPAGKTAVDVFGDFLSYLFRCTRSFIIDTHANGPALWHAVENDIQFVLSHPNGWEGAQQSKMRRAAVYGGLIPDTDEGRARIRFVTEGEASLHACVLNGLAADVLQDPSGHGFIVADAGGGTLDISSYAIRGTAPLVIEEIAPPDCVFAGSVFVSRRARAFFGEKLKSSKYGTSDALDHITKRFDETTKRLFRDSKEMQFVPFGSPLDKDISVGIRGGQLKLTGTEVAALFEPSIEAAIASIKTQIDASGGTVKSVWLVGGFAASPWLFSQLQERLAGYHVAVSRPDTQTSKAVADGAIGFYCDHHVSARISKFMYGVEYLREFDPKDEEHVARKHRLFEMPSGPKLLPDAFDCILARSVRVKESNVFSRKYCTEVTNLSTLSVFEVEIWCYRGGDTVPKWIHRSSEVFSTLCYVRADLSPLAGSAQAKQGRNGKMYWTIVFSIEIHFGLTEFKARIKWVDNGRTKYGPASIVYNEGGQRAEEEEPDSSPEDNVTVLSSASDKYPSRSISQVPSRNPSTRTSAQASPRIPEMARVPEPIPRSFDVERTRTTSTSSSASRHADRSKARELAPPSVSASTSGHTVRSSAIPEPMRTGDRSVNVSGRSAESGRSGSTHLGEALNAVWGAAPPVPSPLAENPPFNAFSSASVSRHETKPATPREMSKALSPTKEASVAPSPPAASKPATPPAGRTPSALSYADPPKSKAPTPPAAPTAPQTPVAASKAATPSPSKAATPVASKAATPAQSKIPTPAASKVPTPTWGSKVPTPAAASKVPTPQSQSKAATPRASKAATPKAATPAVVSRSLTPKPEPAPEPEPAPAPAPVAEPAPAPEPTPVPHFEAPPPVSRDTVFTEITHAPPGAFSDDPVIPPFPDEPPPPAGVMSPMADLWATPVPDPVPASSTGLFSNFLSNSSWDAAPAATSTSKPGFGGFGSALKGGFGAAMDTGFGGFGSSLAKPAGAFGSLTGSLFGGTPAAPAVDHAAAEREAEAARAKQEAEERDAAAAAERMRIEQEEAESRRLAEEAAAAEAAREAEEQRKQAEEDERRKKEEEEEAALKKTPKKMTKKEQMAQKKKEAADKKAKEDEERRVREEEERKVREAEEEVQRANEAAEAAKKAEEDAKKAEEEAAAAALQAEHDAAEAAKKAQEEAEAAKKAEEEAAAAAAAAHTAEEAAAAAAKAEEAKKAEEEAAAAAKKAEEEAAEAKQAAEAEAAAHEVTAVAEEATKDAEDEAAEAKRKEEEEMKKLEDEWGPAITVKGKKGKKGSAGTTAANTPATPDAMSRAPSGAAAAAATPAKPLSKAQKKAQKKKGKKMAFGDDDDAPGTPTGEQAEGDDADWTLT